MSSAPESWLEIYTANPEVGLVIYKSIDDTDKIIGRALLWQLKDGKEFLDRIYTVNDSDVQLFRDYAKENGWYYKEYNNSSDSGFAIAPDGSRINLDLTVNLTDASMSQFPYLDTLKYFSSRSKTISNKHVDGCYVLEDTGGDYVRPCDTCGGEGRMECSDCDGSGSEECNNCSGNGEVDCSECDGSGKEECSNCNGSGNIEGSDGEEECSDCDGLGKVDCSSCDGKGKEECSDCGGEGNSECSNCGGNGEVECYDCH
jgi:DnaJ-class molecular chaperone